MLQYNYSIQWVISEMVYIRQVYIYLWGKCFSITIKLYLMSRVIHRRLYLSCCYVNKYVLCMIGYNDHTLHNLTAVLKQLSILIWGAIQMTGDCSVLCQLCLICSESSLCVLHGFKGPLLQGDDSAKWQQEGSSISWQTHKICIRVSFEMQYAVNSFSGCACVRLG